MAVAGYSLPRMTPAADILSLLEADPELADRLDPTERERAGRDALVRIRRLSLGEWDAAASIESDTHHRGFLLVDGLLTREVDVMGRRCCELLGPGDVMRPWNWDEEGSHVQGAPPEQLRHHRLLAAMT